MKKSSLLVIGIFLIILFSGCTTKPTITKLENGKTKYETTLQGGFSFEVPSGFEYDEEGAGFGGLQNELVNENL